MGSVFGSTCNTRPILADSLRFIRSDAPSQLSEQETAWLIAHDVRTIIDLRTEEERVRKPCPLVEDARFRYECRPVTGGNAIPDSADAVSQSYKNMVDEQLHETIERIWHASSNVLYFCNAGKDRTGVVSAILLYKAGVPIKTIVEDYMKSGENLKSMLEAFAKQMPSVDPAVITPQERYIREFLEWYIENHQDGKNL